MGFGLWGWLGSEWEVGHNYDVDDDDLEGLGSACICVCAHVHVGGRVRGDDSCGDGDED